MERLKLLRQENNLLQKDVASALGIGRTTYVKYESGVSEPSIEMILKIADIFHVSTDFLLGHDTVTVSSTFPSSTSLTAEEQRLLAAYRSSDDRAREDAMNTLLSHPRETQKKDATEAAM